MKTKSRRTSSRFFIPLLVLSFLTLQFCKSAQRTTVLKPENENVPLVSYEKDILPLMSKNCTPCHFPEEGKKKMLNTYEALRESITEIIFRIQLPEEDIKFMPFKSKKPPLTNAEKALFREWLRQEMPR